MRRLGDGILQREEISYRGELQAGYESEEIIQAMCDYFKVSRDEVLKGRVKWRNMAIYLRKRFTGMTNGQIGQLFGDLSYSAGGQGIPEILGRSRKGQGVKQKG